MKQLKYELIAPCDYHEFLSRLGSYKRIVFFPQTPETLSRIAVEARMMGMAVVTNQNVGATKEKWFGLKGVDLIEVMHQKRKEIPQIVKEILNG
jgi:purine nucleoside phosphorylase